MLHTYEDTTTLSPPSSFYVYFLRDLDQYIFGHNRLPNASVGHNHSYILDLVTDTTAKIKFV